MSIARIIPKGQEEEIRCTQCGSSNTVPGAREGRSKCQDCSFSFDNDASKAAAAAGAIPDASPETLALASDAETITQPEQTAVVAAHTTIPDVGRAKSVPIPKTPKYVFVTKDRLNSEFVTQRNLKKTALRWEASGIKYDCYELTVRKSVVRLEIE